MIGSIACMASAEGDCLARLGTPKGAAPVASRVSQVLIPPNVLEPSRCQLGVAHG
jgi:hypothetical protein